MGDKTGISWTGATWNPIVGCSVCSPGCKNCYAMREAHRLSAMGMAKYAGLTDVVKGKPVFNGTVRLAPEALDQPIRWNRPRAIFVNSMSDIGHEALDQADVFKVFHVMERASHHVYQVLTKRPEVLFDHLIEYVPHTTNGFDQAAHTAFEHVWWGVSVEDQARADERLEYALLLDQRGYRVWVSYEPAIGPVDWTGWEFIAGMVSGGESGPGARPSHPDWHRETRDWCAKHGIPYDFKQWGEWVSPEETYTTDAPEWRRIRGSQGDPAKAFVFPDGQALGRVGKKAAGRSLDGQIHDGFTRACAPAGRA